jgi:hypothetical protein
MTAVLVLIGIVVVIIAAIVLLAVPVRHAEAVANGVLLALERASRHAGVGRGRNRGGSQSASLGIGRRSLGRTGPGRMFLSFHEAAQGIARTRGVL